jgi:murein DD-endopeptidase MepM/ murein hydrolase activator NlpD
LKKICTIIVLFFVTIPLSGQQFRLLRPVGDTIQNNGSYLFGEPNISNNSLAHRGLDILVRYDTVYSASNGIVDFVGYNPNDPEGGYEPSGCGNYVIVKSIWEANDIYLLYCHLTNPLVSLNDTLIAGQPIAISGNTGYSTGPHLHFEIRMHTKDFSAVRSRRNPELWFAIRGTGAIYGNIPNAPNSTRVDISPDPKPRPPYTTFGWALTYNFNDIRIGSDEVYKENYAIGDMKPGTYTITALGGAYRRVVTVGAGEVVNADPPVSVDDSFYPDMEYVLHQNYPNPFNPTTVISFVLSTESNVNLRIFDLLGREVENLIDERKAPGAHTAYFTAGDLPSGVYIYSLTIQSLDGSRLVRENKRMVLLR